jgi:thioredoxin 1
MALIPVTERNFEAEVMTSELPVLLEFGAEWCGPCKTVAPELLALSEDLRGKLKVVTIDIDKSPMLARQFGVQSVPAFVVMDKGRPLGGKVGAMTRKQLREMVEPVLPRAAGAVKPKELQALLKAQKVVPVDIREAAVFKRAHIAGAHNFPEDEIQTRLAELHMLTGPAVLYCRGGDKAPALAQKLAAAGVPVAFLEGGVLEWEAAGFDMER